LVLRILSFSGRHVYVQGALAKIQSIHFARWTLIDGGRRLLFFSNFDGSWQSYLGEFVDKSPAGITAIWSNCVGFPKTDGLTGGGAAWEASFRAYVRDHQTPTAVWYGAYRNLSIRNINNNSRIRRGLVGSMTDTEARDWLALF
jgi:hypothetical protein